LRGEWLNAQIGAGFIEAQGRAGEKKATMKMPIEKKTTANAEGRKPTVTPMGFLADLGTKLMHGEALTETEAHYLRTLVHDEGQEFGVLHFSLHHCEGASLTEDQRGVLQLPLRREEVMLYEKA
jgi:hypothetical protein